MIKEIKSYPECPIAETSVHHDLEIELNVPKCVFSNMNLWVKWNLPVTICVHSTNISKQRIYKILWKNLQNNYLKIAIHFIQRFFQEKAFFIRLKIKMQGYFKAEKCYKGGGMEKPTLSLKILHVGM